MFSKNHVSAMSRLAVTSGFLVLSSCASTALETQAGHPAWPSGAAPIQIGMLNAPAPISAADAPPEPHDSSADHHHHHAAMHPHAPAELEGEQTEHASNASTPRYACPMHPEIIRDKPGNCPLCGMKLVEEEKEPPPGGKR